MFSKSVSRAFSVAARQQRVGFIGVGNMGQSMALNLQKNGFAVRGFDVFEGARNSARDQGLEIVDTIAEAVHDADFVVSAVPATAHVTEAMAGAGGVFASAPKGTLIMDSSTILPAGSKLLVDGANAVGMTFIDTPMSGGVMGALNGTLSFMCGGEDDAIERAVPVLNGMGKNIFHCGPAGQGLTAKLANNLILGSNMIALSEALSIGESLGGDPMQLSDVFAASSGKGFVVDTYSPVPHYREGTPASKGYNGGFMVKLLHKDLGLAVQAAKDCGATLQECGPNVAVYERMMELGLGDKDYSYVYQYFKAGRQTPPQ